MRNQTEDGRAECDYCTAVAYLEAVSKTEDGQERTVYLCHFCAVGEKLHQAMTELPPEMQCGITRPHEYRTGTKELESRNGNVYMVFTCVVCGYQYHYFVGAVQGPPEDWRVVD